MLNVFMRTLNNLRTKIVSRYSNGKAWRENSSPSAFTGRVLFDAPDPAAAVTGVIPLAFEFIGSPGESPRTCTLVLSFPSERLAAFRKDLLVGEGRTKADLRLNSHLLPNGSNNIQAQLISGDGGILWERSFSIRAANTGKLAEAVRASMQAFGTALVVDGGCDASHYDFADPKLKPWFDRPDASEHIRSLKATGKIDAGEAKWLDQFVTDGFIVADNLLEPDLLDQISAELEDVVARKVQGYEYGSSQRVRHLHLTYPGVRRLWSHPKIMRLLNIIFASTARPCQTLTYIFGSQQDAHQDTIHLTPFPAGYMCGVWVAIDDVQPGSGELVVYRGSHRTPRLYMKDMGCTKVVGDDWSEFGRLVVPRWQHLIEEGEFEKIIYRPKRGSVLIWHENLMHAGSVRTDLSLSRRSIVSHVFADGAVAFYDATGMAGHMESLLKT